MDTLGIILIEAQTQAAAVVIHIQFPFSLFYPSFLGFGKIFGRFSFSMLLSILFIFISNVIFLFDDRKFLLFFFGSILLDFFPIDNSVLWHRNRKNGQQMYWKNWNKSSHSSHTHTLMFNDFNIMHGWQKMDAILATRYMMILFKELNV